MCRFLAAVADAPLATHELLTAFAEMAETSRSPDGDRQGDGWGVAWLAEDGEWQRYRSLAPVWEDRASFTRVPAATALAVHARSASFAADRGRLAHNQPYLLGRQAFVFNGLLTGVSLPGRRPGEIGAQRLARLLSSFLRRDAPAEALARLHALLLRRAVAVPALNLAVCGAQEVTAISHFETHPEYYRLHHARDNGSTLLCSQPILGLAWRPLPNRTVSVLPARDAG
jgi:predicted glutamine amidotransferase